MSRIISIGTAVPQFSAKQSEILEFMIDAYKDATASRILKILFHSSGINTRHSVLPDFGNFDNKNNFFVGNKIPNVEKRMEVYQENASNLALKAIQNTFQKISSSPSDFEITHLITVSCTGLFIPGIDAEIIEELGLPGDIHRITVNFSGCNAAFSALKIADAISNSDKKARILIVCVELCTIHFQPVNNYDNLLSNTIFGDGAAAVLMVSDDTAQQKNLSGLAVGGFYSDLLSEGKNLMGWNIKPTNFEMVLDSKVPSFISEHIKPFIDNCEMKLKIDAANINKWAIHPGGRKILDVVQKNLQLSNDEMENSYQILKEFGNMSSPTILFVLNEIVQQDLTSGENILAIGFGPGISVDSIFFTYVR